MGGDTENATDDADASENGGDVDMVGLEDHKDSNNDEDVSKGALGETEISLTATTDTELDLAVLAEKNVRDAFVDEVADYNDES